VEAFEMTKLNGSRRATGAVGLLVVVAMVAACGSESAGSGGSIAETSWSLSELDGEAPVGDAPLTIVFGPGDEATPGDAFGSTGCNSFSGPYTTESGAISMGPFITTLAGCVNPPVQAQEGKYLITLETAASYTVSGDTLELRDDGGETTATFTEFVPNLTLSNWVATGINNGSGGVESVIQGTEVTIEFGDVGTLAGFGGCNTYSSAYRVGDEYSVVDGGSIQVAGVAAQRKACEEDVMTQEANYFTALENAATYVMRGLDLELRDASGALQVKYHRADS
jgi:heat shock protein HslJ